MKNRRLKHQSTIHELETIHEHTIDVGSLPTNANILDLGCRGFWFTNTLRDMNHNVYPVDIDIFEGESYYRIGISDIDGRCSVNHWDNPLYTSICDGDDITMMTVKSFSEHVGVNHWDLIKMDIEGAEMGILMQCKHPIATQVSVEFHAHCTSQNKEQIDKCLNYLSTWYHIFNRDWRKMYGHYNYWDVLLVSKKPVNIS